MDSVLDINITIYTGLKLGASSDQYLQPAPGGTSEKLQVVVKVAWRHVDLPQLSTCVQPAGDPMLRTTSPVSNCPLAAKSGPNNMHRRGHHDDRVRGRPVREGARRLRWRPREDEPGSLGGGQVPAAVPQCAPDLRSPGTSMGEPPFHPAGHGLEPARRDYEIPPDVRLVLRRPLVAGICGYAQVYGPRDLPGEGLVRSEVPVLPECPNGAGTDQCPAPLRVRTVQIGRGAETGPVDAPLRLCGVHGRALCARLQRSQEKGPSLGGCTGEHVLSHSTQSPFVQKCPFVAAPVSPRDKQALDPRRCVEATPSELYRWLPQGLSLHAVMVESANCANKRFSEETVLRRTLLRFLCCVAACASVLEQQVRTVHAHTPRPYLRWSHDVATSSA